MEKQTIIFTALPNGREADGSLKVSVFISPRLWDTDASVTKMKLSQFDDFRDWPQRINAAAATWKVTFAGGPTLNATVVSDPAEQRFWTALFKDNTDVLPYRFDDYRGAVIETFPSDVIHDFLVGVYTRAASDPALGTGRNLPTVEALAADPAIRDIANDIKPQEVPKPGPPPPPRDLGGTLPRPEPEPPVTQPSTGCCLCGCLMGILLILATPFPGLRSRLKKFCAKREPAPKPSLSTEPKPVPEPPAPPIPDVPPPPPSPKPPKPPSVNRAAFADLQNFLTPATEVSQALPTAAELKQKYDFHHMVSALADYPNLLRNFGLVVDLRVTLNGAAVSAQSTVTVEPTLTLTDAADTTIVSPRTNYDLDVDKFAARPRPFDPEISNGMLRFDDANTFRVVQVDIVGGGAKMQAAANNDAAAADDPARAPNSPKSVGLPALRSGGISVIRLNMADDLIRRFRRSHALQQAVVARDNAPQRPIPVGAPPPIAATEELFAEDLVHGYRIDVFDAKSNRWHSLCQRVGTYTFLDAPDAPGGSITVKDVADEGFVQFAVTEPVAAAPQKKLRTRDSLFVWDGWSLCAPRPSKSIMPNKPGDPLNKVTLDTPKNEAITNFKLETSFEAKPGSLPRFRFDHTYRLRARVCDLAGNSVFGPDDLLTFNNDVAEQTPDFHCARFEPIAPPAMMLRKAPVEGESLEHLVVRSPAVGGESQTTERHVVPPKVSQLMAEQHGKFDRATQKMDSSTTTGYDVAAREAGALNDPPATQVKKDIWVNAGDQFTVTYLPDPASRGTLLMGLPGMANDDDIVEPTAAKRVNKIPFEGTWPHSLPFRLRLVAIPDGVNAAEPRWEDTPADPRVLIVELPESQKKVVRISSYLEAEDLDRQGVLQWTREEAPANLATIEADTEAGRSWLHLPWRDITLVHAVQKPLKPLPTAAVNSPAGKALGQTFATISGTLTTHVPSTGKVDLVGSWKDPLDDPAQPKPGEKTSQSYLCEVVVDEKDVTTNIKSSASKKDPIHNFGDTKFHKVRYTPIATTRFREYFPPSITNDPANISVAGPPSNEVTILNSARPEAPKVLYVIPTFEWEDEPPFLGKVTRKRKGGLRVYLDRPWFSSGAGELLGVVYADGVNFTDLDEELKKLVTVWGSDPIWMTGPTGANATAASFVGSVGRPNLSLAEHSQLVSVAGYEPQFDETRRLWFADIEIDIGDSYAPFVRLGLARFQPESVPNAHLSRIVRAQFAQIAPDRTASITTTTPTPSSAKFDFFVSGLTYVASSATMTGIRFGDMREHDGRAEFEALLQKRSMTMGDDPDLGWDTMASIMLTPDAAFGEWKGELNIAEALAPNTWRILIKEYEWYRADFQPEEARENREFARRIVYAVAIPLG